MAISTTDIAGLIGAALPDARLAVQGDGGKYQVQVIADTFTGLTRVKRQQVLYRILNDHIQRGALHAVSMQMQTPDEADHAARPGS